MDPNRRLKVHHVVFVATFDNVVVLVTLITEAPPRVFAHPVQGKDFEPIGISFVHRQNHSPLPSRHIFGHVKAEAAKTAECASLFSLVGCFYGMSAVFDNHESVPPRDRDQRVHVASAAGDVDWHDGLCPARDFGRDFPGIDIERSGVHVGQNRLGACMNDGIDRRTEGQSRRNDFISRTDTCGQHAQVQCRRARVHRHRIRSTLVVAKLAFELSNFRPGTKPAGLEAVQYLPLLLVADQRRAENQKVLRRAYWFGGV